MEHPIQITPEILEAFGLPRDCASTRLHGGHINDTFLVENGGKYVIQRINRYVFPSPQDIMENITGVTEFLREKILARGGDPLRGTLNIRRTTQGGTLFVDEEGGPWRCMTFVDKATSHETVESPAMLRDSELQDLEARQAFYQKAVESLHLEGSYLLLLAHDTYDVPTKAKDGAALEDGEIVFSYLLCAVCPVKEGKPGLGYYAGDN